MLDFLSQRFGGRLRMKVKDLAIVAGMPEQSVRNALCEGVLNLTPIREGKALYFSTLELVRLLASQEPIIQRRRRGRPRHEPNPQEEKGIRPLDRSRPISSRGSP